MNNKDNIKRTFSAIRPSDECMERINDMTKQNKKRIRFAPAIALVACLAIVITGVVGYNVANSHLSAGGVEEHVLVEVPDKAFTITAYAGEDDNKTATVLDSDKVVLADYKLSWVVESDGGVSLHGSGESGFSVAGENIKSVTYSCKNGEIGFAVDVNKIHYLKSQGKFYDVILPYLDEYKNPNDKDRMDVFREHFVKGEYDKYFTDTPKKNIDDYWHIEEIYSDDESEITGIGVVSNEVWESVSDSGELKQYTFENYFNSTDAFGDALWSPDGEVFDNLLNGSGMSFEDIPHDTVTISVAFNDGTTKSISYDLSFNKNGNLVLNRV